MSEDKKVEEEGAGEGYRTLTCAGWLERVEKSLEDLRKSPYELEEVRKLSEVEKHLAGAVEYLREAVMSLAMEFTGHLLNNETKEEKPPAGGRPMAKKK